MESFIKYIFSKSLWLLFRFSQYFSLYLKEAGEHHAQSDNFPKTLLSIALRILYCAYGVLILINWSNLQHCKYVVNRSHTLKQSSKHVREVVNGP